MAKFFSHQLATDAISWEVLAAIRLTEDDTTSSSRIFIKILFQARLLAWRPANAAEPAAAARTHCWSRGSPRGDLRPGSMLRGHCVCSLHGRRDLSRLLATRPETNNFHGTVRCFMLLVGQQDTLPLAAQELSENMGLSKLNARLQDPLCAPWFGGLFPRDSPRNMRFSINFFTSIGLGGLTDALRAHLKARCVPATPVWELLWSQAASRQRGLGFRPGPHSGKGALPGPALWLVCVYVVSRFCWCVLWDLRQDPGNLQPDWGLLPRRNVGAAFKYQTVCEFMLWACMLMRGRAI